MNADTQQELRGWKILADPGDVGLKDRWFERPPVRGWRAATVPGSFHKDLGVDARGVVWYRATLPAEQIRQAGADRRAWVRFESVATDCRAWLGGIEIGRHIGDYLPFEFEIPAGQGPGPERELLVRVDQVFAPKPAPGVLVQNGHLGKGFHDVLSLQHGGIWAPVHFRTTLDWAIRAGGVHVVADPDTGRVRIRVEFWPGRSPAMLSVSITAAGIREGAVRAQMRIGPGQTEAELVLQVTEFERWSPENPARQGITVSILQDEGIVSDTALIRFGFRACETGGPGNRHILLNGRPVLLRGMLHWGHEPAHIAPAPSPGQVREEFARLKELGFNCVCLCMVYPPEHYYDIADEVGMLIWQEHPVWKSPMGDEHLREYRRLYEGYFRRHRNHPSVVVVSGACEHEQFNAQLAAWWWERAGVELPHALKQVQTAFFGWSDLDRTDLYDEHTYENSGRWACYVRDVGVAIERLPQGAKPFVLGETILSNAWPDVEMFTAESAAAPWWATGGLRECAEFEKNLRDCCGAPTVQRFRRQARRHNLNLRQFQCELLRRDPRVGGWVMNHLRDVPACRCGFMDDAGRWRYEPHELRGFLGDAALLLETPDSLRAFDAGAPLTGRLHLSNFAERELTAHVALEAVVGGRSAPLGGLTLTAEPGEVVHAGVALGRYQVDRPTLAEVVASAPVGSLENRWPLWMLPPLARPFEGVLVAEQVPLRPEELALEFEEKCYSSGWGLPVESWSPRPQVPRELLPDAAVGLPGPGRVAVGHRLDEGTLASIERGGRFLLLASRGRDGLSAKTTMLWAGVPLVLEAGPIRTGDTDWIVDALHHDLSRRFQRAVPTEALGLARSVQPLIRFLHTHDSGVPRIYDFSFAVRVGAGLLVVSSVDHYEAAGRYWLGRVLQWMRSTDPAIGASVNARRILEIVA